MFSERDSQERNTDSTELELEELMAARPIRAPGTLLFGHRLPGGERVRRVQAQGTDFESISPYVQGDDVRHIDWRSSARTARTQMRRFSAASHRARSIVMDLKPALRFGTQPWPMLKTSLLAAAWIGWEARMLNEPLGLAVGTESEFLPPRSGKRQVERVMRRLWQCWNEISQFKAVPLVPLVQRAASVLRQGDDLFLISDFPSLEPDFQRTSLELAERRNLTIVIVEDAMFRAPIKPGTYPVQNGKLTKDISISARDSSHAMLRLDNLRREQHRALADCGWQVLEALDLPLFRGSQV